MVKIKKIGLPSPSNYGFNATCYWLTCGPYYWSIRTTLADIVTTSIQNLLAV